MYCNTGILVFANHPYDLFGQLFRNPLVNKDKDIWLFFIIQTHFYILLPNSRWYSRDFSRGSPVSGSPERGSPDLPKGVKNVV